MTALSLHEVHLYRGRLDRPEDEVDRFVPVLSTSERERAARFHRPRDANRWIVARAELRLLLARALECPVAHLRLTTGRNGKPRLQEANPTGGMIHFNLSHAGPVVLYALTHIGELGVDIEPVEEVVDPLGLARLVFSPKERADLRSLPAEMRTKAFLLGWTRKEAVVKATGEGLSWDLAGFDVSLIPGEPAEVTGWRLGTDPPRMWQLVHLDPLPGIVGALALRSDTPVRVQWRDLPSIDRDVVVVGPHDLS